MEGNARERQISKFFFPFLWLILEKIWCVGACSCDAALRFLCVLFVLVCRFGGRKLSICSTNRTKLRLPQSNTRVPVRAKAKVSLTVKITICPLPVTSYYCCLLILFFHDSCGNRNRDSVTEQSAQHSVPVPCTSPRCGSHWCSSSPSALGGVPVPDWASATGDRGKSPCAYVYILYLQANLQFKSLDFQKEALVVCNMEMLH